MRRGEMLRLVEDIPLPGPVKELGVERRDHVQFVIAAMRGVAPSLGLEGASE